MREDVRSKTEGTRDRTNMQDGIYILAVFSCIILVPLLIVFGILTFGRRNRRRKEIAYTGRTQGKVIKIVHRGLDSPWVIHVGYSVNGVDYEIKETAKMKSQAIRVGRIPVGQKKTFVLGSIREGDFVTVCYDEAAPQKAIIYGNDGVMTG